MEIPLVSKLCQNCVKTVSKLVMAYDRRSKTVT